MSIQCKDGDLVRVTRDEPGLEANIGRFLWVYGPVMEHPELGPVWETIPATSEPMAYLDAHGELCFDRSEGGVIHPDAWMTPVPSDSFFGNRPAKQVAPVPLTPEWLETVANSGPAQVYLHLPRRDAPETPGLAGAQLRMRLHHELCIPIQEDYGCYASWLWFPGRSLSATAHWWVHEAPLRLIGEVYGLADVEAYEVYDELESNGKLPWVFADGDWNTYMVLPARFKANLIPRFARATFDIGECRTVKYRRRNGEQRFTHVQEDDELLANWRISESIAESSEPEAFLENLRRALLLQRTATSSNDQ
jgi:hypothetical protein